MAGRGSMRDAMPGSAHIVDWLRQALGAAVVDQALAAGVRLQREHAALVQSQGQRAADAWLAQQRPAGPSMVLREQGRVVGAVPGRVVVSRTRRMGR